MNEVNLSDLLSYIKYEEEISYSWDNRFWKTKSRINTTKELTKNHNRNSLFSEQTIFLVSKWLKVSVVVFAIFWGYIILLFYTNPYSLFIIVPFLLLLILMTYKVLTGKEFRFRIVITKRSIEVENKSYKWEDILETYIVERLQGRSPTSFLIVVLKDGRMDISILNNLALSFEPGENKLAKAIEYYKAEAKKLIPLPSPASTSGTLHSP